MCSYRHTVMHYTYTFKLVIHLSILLKLIVMLNVQVPAGLFIPSMAIGACIGRVLGIGVEQLAL